ncbi:alpha/beta fold hydrolase [Cellulomonas pakistanensis]|uniref:2-hydroxy-6-oxo-6-phenylhexa-2,4-dienoate hydrolase n=1 Tax=Cellulomonas pakistanensis TaxID=992287 RepID=A0A919P8J6_9CELL|nr:alpha/beta hydrolase [Cellulomonas pakistanensis]GIG35608.1 2-hydroxy-6-oxo-6-phenylhexa-2,4-dienoate hydrolase [Cellulomonas pakistanensis]
MQLTVDGVAVHHVAHGTGRPVVVLHGAGVDHREPEACLDAGLAAVGGLRRVYPDVPGHGRTPAPPALRSEDDVVAVLTGFVEAVGGGEPVLLVGHSAGAHDARGVAARRPDLVAGLALVCPLVAGGHPLPAHAPVVRDDALGDDEFRGYFVVQTPAMLDRHRRFVEPGAALADAEANARIGERWEIAGLDDRDAPPYEGPVLVVAGRRDSTVGYAGAVGLLDRYPRATLAVVDGAGHALPHERPDVLAALLADWAERVPAPS